MYLNNKKIQTKEVSSTNILTIPKQKIGVYDLKIIFSEPDYQTTSKTVKLTINPKSEYNIKLVLNPALFTGRRGTLRGHVE